MQLTLRFSLFILLCSLYVGCNKSSPTGGCIPNYSGDGLSVYISRKVAAPNQYEVTICENNRTNFRTVSIYGVSIEARLGLVSTANLRLPNIEDSTEIGDRFEITFQNDDRWFIFYEDDLNGNPSYLNELVRGELPY